MADYALPCPVCQGPMYDQMAPGNKFPYVEGRPIAVCKNKKTTGCTGVYWKPKGAAIAPSSAPTRTAAVPQPVATYTPKAQVPVDKDVGDYYAILTAVLVHHAAFTKEAPLAGPQAEDIANTATFSDLRTIATTISIARNGGRG